MNKFTKLLNADPDSFQEFLDCLSENEITVYGISIVPRDLARLRRVLQEKYNVLPEELIR